MKQMVLPMGEIVLSPSFLHSGWFIDQKQARSRKVVFCFVFFFGCIFFLHPSFLELFVRNICKNRQK